MKVPAIVSVSAIAAAVVSGCVGLTSPVRAAGALDAPPIEIAVIGPYSGGSADMGISMLNGVKLAAEQINKNGGVLGRPIMLIERDDAAHNEMGARIAREMTRDHPVVAGIGVINTGVALAAEPYFEEARIPLMVSAATGTTITSIFAPGEYDENYIFRFATSTKIEAAAIVQEAVREHHRVFAIFSDTTSYGQAGREDLTTALAQYGLAPAAIEKFNIGDTDMINQLRRARAAGVDVILTYGIGPELAALARGRSVLGWDVPIIGSWTLSMSSFIEGAAKSGEGAVMPETFIAGKPTPAQTAFENAYAAEFGQGMASPVSAAQGYDSLLVLAAAITQAGSTDGNAIRTALEQLRVPVRGVIKDYIYPFDATQHEAIHPGDIDFGVVKDGRIVHFVTR